MDLNQATAALRAAFIEYWLKSIRSLGTHPATGKPLIVGEKNQRLYWLMFLSSNLLRAKAVERGTKLERTGIVILRGI